MRFPAVWSSMAFFLLSYPAAAAPQVTDRPLRPKAPQAFTASARTATHRLAVASAEWAHASSAGLFVGGTRNKDGVTAGEAGKAYLYPGRKPIPAFQVYEHATEFSPDGALLMVGSNLKSSRPTPNAPWVRAKPQQIIYRVPSMQEVQRFEGWDAAWVGPASIDFRRGAQAYHLDVGQPPTTVGVAQRAYGCADDRFEPESPCRQPSFTSLLGRDRPQTFFVVETYTALANAPHASHVDLLNLATGSARTLVAVDDPKNEGHWLRSTFVSPNARRICAWRLDEPVKPGTSELDCASLPGGVTERIMSTVGDALETRFVDDDHLAVLNTDGVHYVDLVAGTDTHLDGLPADLGGMYALPGAYKLVFQKPTLVFVDLASGTFLDTRTPTVGIVEPMPNHKGVLVKRGTKYWEAGAYEVWSD